MRGRPAGKVLGHGSSGPSRPKHGQPGREPFFRGGEGSRQDESVGEGDLGVNHCGRRG